MYRPCFLYTPDFEEYTVNRGFDEEIHTWGFPVAVSNQELSEAILAFDEQKFREAMQRHHEFLGSYENGTATEAVCQVILKKIKEDSL
jgi:CDP-glycerol glycerophosphotransferase